MWVGVVAMVLLQLAFTYVPSMQQVFKTASIGWQDWLLIALGGLSVAVVVSLEKWWLRR